MKRIKTGWIVETPASVGYAVNDYSGDEPVKRRPTAIFVEGIKRNQRILQYAGLPDGDQMPGFQLPTDPNTLRQLAEALNKVADEIETHMQS